MTNGCPPGAPVELADGRIVMPEDTLTLAEICEIVPLIIESMMKAGANGKLTPGQAVQVAKSPFGPFGTPAIPSQRPGALPGSGGAIAPSGGAPGGWGGGGGRGSRGVPGPRGPQGPPGTGSVAVAVKTDGNFIVASVSPFIPVPGTGISFTPSEAGHAIFLIQAVFGGNSVSDLANGQLGLRVDGVDYPLTANLVHAMVVGVDQFLAGVHASFPVLLSAAPHTAELIVRGDSSLGAPTGSPLTVQANATIPLALTVLHK